MDPITIGALLGGGLGLGKGYMDQQSADRDRQTQAAIAKYSPWTGMQARVPQDPSMLGSASQGAMTGAMMGSMYKPTAAATSSVPTYAGGASQATPWELMSPQQQATGAYNMGPAAWFSRT